MVSTDLMRNGRWQLFPMERGVRLKRDGEGADEGEEEENMIYLYRTDA